MSKQPKILFFDIETSLMKAYLFGLGKQVIRHNQLDKAHCQPRIICVTYCWNDGKPAQCIDWGYEEQDSKKVVQEFDKVINQADLVLGKNSKRFDEKMINAVRMLHDLPGNPEWTKYSEDLEQQMRRYFRLPSQSLDYISGQMGLGGKIKMEFMDWVHILEKTPKDGPKAFAKMLKYGKKDVVDTRTLWNKLEKHFDTKINMATYNEQKHACKHCGSGADLVKNGHRFSGGSKWQSWSCNASSCNGRYAGRTPMSPVEHKLGKMT